MKTQAVVSGLEAKLKSKQQELELKEAQLVQGTETVINKLKGKLDKEKEKRKRLEVLTKEVSEKLVAAERTGLEHDKTLKEAGARTQEALKAKSDAESRIQEILKAKSELETQIT